MTVLLDGQSLTLGALEGLARGRGDVALSPGAREAVARARRVVDEAVARGSVVYGVNTGFGNFADVVIPKGKLSELQLNLVRSHAAGVGDPLGEAETRALMVLRANTLAKGYSGIRPATLELLVAMINARVHPVIPSQGSVGASGDLAPLAHLALALVGEGSCVLEGRTLSSADALRARGLAPVVLEAKEGLALINGTALITGIGALAAVEAGRLFPTADVAGALSLDALKGTDVAFDPRIHALRPLAGQQASARNLRRLLQGSPIRESHRDCGKVQDAYSLRCMPQVHGACRDALRFAQHSFEVELNAATDNPMVFADTAELLSGGNFHGQPVAMAADVLALCATEIGAISERRIERLMNPALSDLPAFLVREGGLNSGLMLAHVTAAALASENKVLAHPASVDSIPTSGLQEDYNAMGGGAALKARRAVGVARQVLAIEILLAAQALDLRAPLVPGRGSRAARDAVRQRITALTADRYLKADLDAALALAEDGSVVDAAAAAIGTLE
jgi:histidine ammonia-lyase